MWGSLINRTMQCVSVCSPADVLPVVQDGNTDDDDGCSATCTIEDAAGRACAGGSPTEASVCGDVTCGDSKRLGAEVHTNAAPEIA